MKTCGPFAVVDAIREGDMAENDSIQAHVSFARCLTNERFFDRFYEHFMTSHPDVKPRFAHTDMEKQRHLLRHGVASALKFANEESVMTRSAINRIRESYDHQHLDIKPELYDFWLDSLMKTVAESGPEFTPTLDRLWRDELAPAISYIKAGY